jgi:signal transduction histidine kinase
LIRISVTDTGVGMPPSVLNRLFNQYATFDHNNGSNKHGVGLGLVICKRLVGMLGPYEKINVESTESIGSSFTFLIYQYMNDDAEANSNLKNSKYFFT